MTRQRFVDKWWNFANSSYVDGMSVVVGIWLGYSFLSESNVYWHILGYTLICLNLVSIVFQFILS